jgi:hypothetical protein
MTFHWEMYLGRRPVCNIVCGYSDMFIMNFVTDMGNIILWV